MASDDVPPEAISGRILMEVAEKAWGEKLCCIKCYEAKHKDERGKLLASPMFLCPMCGNKRCPKSTDHELACTGSNKPGQPGSVYE